MIGALFKKNLLISIFQPIGAFCIFTTSKKTIHWKFNIVLTILPRIIRELVFSLCIEALQTTIGTT